LTLAVHALALPFGSEFVRSYCHPRVFTSFAAAQVVTGLCVSLFVAALFLTIFWRIPLEGATLALGHRRVKKGLFSGKRSRDVA
jgi:hypothetical protein